MILLPRCLQGLGRPQVKHAGEHRPFGAGNIVEIQMRRPLGRDAFSRPSLDAWCQITVHPPRFTGDPRPPDTWIRKISYGCQSRQHQEDHGHRHRKEIPHPPVYEHETVFWHPCRLDGTHTNPFPNPRQPMRPILARSVEQMTNGRSSIRRRWRRRA